MDVEKSFTNLLTKRKGKERKGTKKKFFFLFGNFSLSPSSIIIIITFTTTMSQGTLYIMEISPRSSILVDLIKYFKLDIEIDANTQSESFIKKFPLGKTPAFVGAKGFQLTETIAISNYFLSLIPNQKLLGKNNQEYANIIKYVSLLNQEGVISWAAAYFRLNGRFPYNKKEVDENLKIFNTIGEILEKRLHDFTYLVGERISYADLFAVKVVIGAVATVFGKPFLTKYPSIARWVKTVSQNEIFQGQFKDLKFPEQQLAFVPPKKEKKKDATPKAESAAPKKKETPAAATSASEEPAAAPKPKHPLEALGKPKNPLDEWKRTYSNEETREVAIPWFWKNQYDPEEWSLWKVDYKYNDELTLTFMSNNLVGGFFNRLSASTKYMFGCMVVYGENNNNGITGAFLVRGQDYVPAFDVAPDWESYEFTKLDGSNEDDKKFINNMFAWDEPVVVNGEKREIADGKVFK